MSTRPLFIYGTLRYGPLFELVAGQGEGASDVARLVDHRVGTGVTGLPVLLAANGQVASGTLWRNLDADRAERLDRYEVPFGYYRKPVIVETAEGAVAADSYFPPPDLTAAGDWSLGDWIALDAVATLLTARELAQHNPALSGQEMARQWPLMRARAEARVRALGQDAPSAVRRRAVATDIMTDLKGALRGDFFKFAAMSLRHRQFDGTMSDALPREVFWGFDASLVLPYDPREDVVLIVEQVRTGPVWRHDPNPWSLEAVAGLIDAGETPEAAALREGREEAGLEISRLERMFAAYPSAGGSSDYFHCFVGVTDIPVDVARYGGLAAENEDLRLHRLSFDAAMALVASGEITAMPLITMLYWLGANRDRLRA